MEQTTRDIKVADLRPSPFNKRVIRKRDPSIKELGRSIATNGLIQNLVVRPVPKAGKEGGYWEIVAGHRRHAAAQVAKVETLRCEVLQLDDAQALEIQVIENLQRQDLDPLEEAEQVAVMMQSDRTDEIAAAIGRDRKWVARRARVCLLVPEWKQAINQDRNREKEDEDSGYEPSRIHGKHKWSIGHLEEIARAPAEIQLRVLKNELSAFNGIPTIRHIRSVVANYSRVLKDAPFDIYDADLLRKVDGCDTCPFRQGATPDLFDDVTSETKLEDDTCLNSPCYKKKVQAHGRRAFRAAREKDPKTIEVNWDNQLQDKDNYYDECRKDDPDAVPAVVTGANGDGRSIFVKKTIYGDPAEPKHDTIGKVRQIVAANRDGQCFHILRTKLDETSWDKMVRLDDSRYGWDMVKLVRFSLILCQMEHPDGESWDWLTGKVGERIKRLQAQDTHTLCAELWECICGGIHPRNMSAVRKDLKAIADFLGFDWKEISAEALKQHPEPAFCKGKQDDDKAPKDWRDQMLKQQQG